jgi:hypothetical protein
VQCDHRRFPEQWQVLSTLAFSEVIASEALMFE